MKTLILSFAILLGSSVSSASTCLLSFEREISSLSKSLDHRFQGRPGVRLVLEAKPTDILDCVQQGAEKIIIVAHSLETRPDFVSLGYFSRLQGEEREQFRLKFIADARIARDQVKNDIGQNQFNQNNSVFIELLAEKNRIEQALRYFEGPAVNPQVPLYAEPRMILPRIFDQILKQIPTSHLKKIYLMNCQENLVQKTYPQFNNMQQQGVQILSAPASRLASSLTGKQSVVFDLGWIERALQ